MTQFACQLRQVSGFNGLSITGERLVNLRDTPMTNWKFGNGPVSRSLGFLWSLWLRT